MGFASSTLLGVWNQKELQNSICLVPQGGIEQEFLGTINRLRERAQEQMMEVLLTKAKLGELSLSEKAQLKDLLSQRETYRID